MKDDDAKFLNDLNDAVTHISATRHMETSRFPTIPSKTPEQISRSVLSQAQKDQFPKETYEAVVNWKMAVDRVYSIEKKSLRNSRNPNRPLVRFSQGTRNRIFVDVYQAPKSRVTGKAEYFAIPRNAEFLYKKKQWLIKSGWTSSELVILRYLLDRAIEWLTNREAQENHTAGMYGRHFTAALYESVDGPCWAFMKPDIKKPEDHKPLTGAEFAKLSKEEVDLYTEYVSDYAAEVAKGASNVRSEEG